MIGDFFSGGQGRVSGDQFLGRLMVLANDLDVPNGLNAGSALSISEAGPIGVFSSSLNSAAEISALLRAGSPLPGANLEGTLAVPATLLTVETVGAIRNQLANTGQPYDVIALTDPGYASGVDAIFRALLGSGGTTMFNQGDSGALLQTGADTLVGGEDLDAFYFYDYLIRFDAGLAAGSSHGLGRLKIAEGGTILPQNRVFFRYNYFDTRGGDSLSRFTPGFERAFKDNLFSFEVRVPFATNSVQALDGASNSVGSGSDTVFGNLTMYAKALLVQREKLSLSGGLGIALPTASDLRVDLLASNSRLLEIQNETVRIQPFLGWLFTPSTDWFAHGFVQCDLSANGNAVLLNGGNGLTQAGMLTDQNFLYADFGVGTWLYRNDQSRWLTGIIPTVEIHHNNSLNSSDSVALGAFQVDNGVNSLSLTNATVGSTFEFRQRGQLTVGYSAPLSGGTDRQYDGALTVMYSALFGG